MEISPVTPMTVLHICSGVKSDTSLIDVLSHSNRDTQYNYYSKKIKYTCMDMVPIRNNVVRVPYVCDDLFDCNYVLWKNANFKDKWFYGFITELNWINVGVTEITIQTDPWETWKFDLTFPVCYVERMHVNNDTFGEWKAPEPFDSSNKLLKLRNTTDYGRNGDYRIAVFYVPQYDFEPSTAGELTNFCVVRIINSDDIIDFYNENLKPLVDVGLQDNIIGAVVVPNFINATGKSLWSKSYSRSNYMNLDGYVPANRKLLTFPYNSLRVASQNGVQGEYWLENFSTDTMSFVVGGIVSLDMMLYGDFQTYERTSSTREEIPNMPYTNVVSGFPQPLLTGIQSLGYAQTASGLAMQAVASVKEYASSFITKSGISKQDVSSFMSRDNNMYAGRRPSERKAERGVNPGDLGNWLLDAGGKLLKGKEKDLERESIPDTAMITTLPASSSAWSVFRGEFQFLHSTIDREKAERYDVYLTRWGYSIQKITTPLISGRRVFNYIQTRDCNVYGNIPINALEAIRAMFNNGVTIWHNENGYDIGEWGGAAYGNPIL